LVARYRRYATSFLTISDERVDEFVRSALKEQRLWPAPHIGLNPAFEPGGTIDDLANDGLLHDGSCDISRIDKSPTDLIGPPMAGAPGHVRSLHRTRRTRGAQADATESARHHPDHSPCVARFRPGDSRAQQPHPTRTRRSDRVWCRARR